MRRLFLVFAICLFTCCLVQVEAQNDPVRKFHFGASGGLIASQIDGDALNGFHKIGYQFGLLGGFAFNEAHWFVMELQYGNYGSKKKNEDVEENLESKISSINVLLGYSLRFGDSWDGVRKFRLIVGPKYHRIINVDGPTISKETLKNQFIALHLGFSYAVSPSLLLDLTYTHSLMNLLEEPLATTDTYVPYYLSVGVSYYVSE